MESYEDNLKKAVQHLQGAQRVMVLSGAGMSTAAGIPDFRSPGGLYGTSDVLLERFTYLEKDESFQRSALKDDVKSALTFQLFRKNPLPYHEMRRGLIIGLGENQWKPTIGHVFPEILNRNNKLLMLASQNIDGLDHKVVRDRRKLYNPHGLMSWLVSEPLQFSRRSTGPLCVDPTDKIYQRYVELVKENIKDIYEDRPRRRGRSSHLWPAPPESTPITLEMFGDLLPAEFHESRKAEKETGQFTVKPGSVLFDRHLVTTNAAGEEYDAFSDVDNCDMMLVMGTSLSGLTIDQLAYSAGRSGKPLVIFDVTAVPVKSCQRSGAWKPERDSLVQGPIDRSILDILEELGWLSQLLEFLPHLCLGSLRMLRQYLAERPGGALAEDLQRVDRAIEDEVEREKGFYGDEPPDE